MEQKVVCLLYACPAAFPKGCDKPRRAGRRGVMEGKMSENIIVLPRCIRSLFKRPPKYVYEVYIYIYVAKKIFIPATAVVPKESHDHNIVKHPNKSSGLVSETAVYVYTLLL